MSRPKQPSSQQEGDFVITMGCGDIFRMVPDLLGALEKE